MRDARANEIEIKTILAMEFQIMMENKFAKFVVAYIIEL